MLLMSTPGDPYSVWSLLGELTGKRSGRLPWVCNFFCNRFSLILLFWNHVCNSYLDISTSLIFPKTELNLHRKIISYWSNLHVIYVHLKELHSHKYIFTFILSSGRRVSCDKLCLLSFVTYCDLSKCFSRIVTWKSLYWNFPLLILPWSFDGSMAASLIRLDWDVSFSWGSKW